MTRSPTRYYTRSDGQTDIVHSITRRDSSPVYRGRYDARCSSCWLGHEHTEAKHARSVGGRR